MKAIYYDPASPYSFGGKNKLKKFFPSDAVEKWIRTQIPYSLHRPLRRRFPTRPYRTGGINELWQMDLIEMIPYHTINDGNKYILACIDVFSRFVRALPVKSKNGVEISEAIEEIIKESDKPPRNIQTDQGKEFYNVNVQNLFKKYTINHYTVNSQFKAPIIERFIRTLREKLTRWFTYKGNKKWVEVLPSLVLSYNNSRHRGIYNNIPANITEENEFELWLKKEHELRERLMRNEKPIKEGDYVRISKIAVSTPWIKNFDQNWSDEIFRVQEIDTTVKPHMYTLEDWGGKKIQGKFYRIELQYIGDERPEVHRIEKILDERGDGIHKQYLVKWHGYSDEYNSWVSANQFVNNGNGNGE